MKTLLSILIFFAFALAFFLPAQDVDFGWHYRCGNDLINGNGACTSNNFTYFLADYQWANPTFGYDILLAVTYNTVDLLGVSILGAIILGTTSYIAYRIYGKNSFEGLLLTMGAIAFSWNNFTLGFRSQHMTLLFFVITLYILLKLPKRHYLLVPLFMIWVNTHAGFFLGPVLIFLYILSTLIKKTYEWSLMWPLCLALAVTLINPFGYRVYFEVFNHFKVPMHTLIAEWVPPHFYYQLGIIVLALFYVGWIYYQKTKYDPFKILLLILITYLGFTARRNLPVFSFGFLMLIADEAPSFNLPKHLAFILLGGILLYIGMPNLIKTLDYSLNPDPFCNKSDRSYPCDALTFFDGKTGNVYNTYEWGSFLIWRVPNMKFFVDGRMPAWLGENGESPYTTWLQILQTQPGWQERLDQYDTDYLFIAPGTFMDLKLKDAPEQYGYKEEQREKSSVIYSRLK